MRLVTLNLSNMTPEVVIVAFGFLFYGLPKGVASNWTEDEILPFLRHNNFKFLNIIDEGGNQLSLTVNQSESV